MKRRGLFITFEGIEGSGKSSQIVALARWLRRHEVAVTLTREPGGTKAGEELRRIFLGPRGKGLDAWAELFLIQAARVQHLAEVIRPALEAGKIVLCDRFIDSTIAYQGYGRGIPLDVLRYLHRLPALGPAPDLTLLFDLPVAEGLRRAAGRNAAIDPRVRRREERIDEESAAFHEKVRRGFLVLAGTQPLRIVKIPAAADPALVTERVRAAVLERLGKFSPSARQAGSEAPGEREAHAVPRGGKRPDR